MITKKDIIKILKDFDDDTVITFQTVRKSTLVWLDPSVYEGEIVFDPEDPSYGEFYMDADVVNEIVEINPRFKHRKAVQFDLD